MKGIICLLLFVFVASCNGVEFIYKDSAAILNPLYEKVEIKTSGIDLSYLNSYLPMFFGKNEQKKFKLFIEIEEKQTKRSVKNNQATLNLRYEITFSYILKSNTKSCTTFKKKILSTFSITPKSDGYNYGTDASLEKNYELAITDNLNRFLSFLSRIDINNCL
tara:strand:- start:2076 stop:2564 length:489 start_codon:yes stop_codon:yes gene_type:complete